MNLGNRRAWLAVALLITLVLTMYVRKMEIRSLDLVETTSRDVKLNDFSLSDRNENKKLTGLGIYISRNISEPKKDIFQANVIVEEKKPEQNKVFIAKPSLTIPSPPPVAAQPTAPPIPFKYLGKYYDQGGLVVFLNYYGKNLIVKSGDTIQQTYRIEEIKPPAMTMTYLPMDIKQIINIGDIN